MHSTVNILVCIFLETVYKLLVYIWGVSALYRYNDLMYVYIITGSGGTFTLQNISISCIIFNVCAPYINLVFDGVFINNVIL